MASVLERGDIFLLYRPRIDQTHTRGEREPSPARPAGVGVYAIVDHGDHTHLAY